MINPKLKSIGWGPSLVKEDWVAVCQAILRGVTVPDMTAMSFARRDMARKLRQKKGGRAKSLDGQSLLSDAQKTCKKQMPTEQVKEKRCVNAGIEITTKLTHDTWKKSAVELVIQRWGKASHVSGD